MKGRVSSSAALSPDRQTVYVGVENRFGGGYVVAIDLADSTRPKWTFQRTKPVIGSSPAVSADGRFVYVGCDDGRLYQLNAANGAFVHEAKVGDAVESSPAIAANGTVYFGSDDGKLYAVSADLGALWSFKTDGAIDSSPALGDDGTIYFGSWDKNVYAVTPAGALKWPAPFPTGGFVSGSPAIGSDGTIYVGSYDQRLYAINPDGTKKWDFFTGDKIWSSPVIGADGTIYFASSDAYFYALNPTGPDEDRLKWKVFLNATTSSTAAVRGDGVIIVGVDGSKVLALDPKDGSKRWEFVAGTGALAYASPLIGPDGSIYIGFDDGFFYKIAGNGSPLSQYSPWPAFRRDTVHTGRAAERMNGGQLLNLSTRVTSDGKNSVIAGFFIHGVGARPYLMRGIGPSLASFGVNAYLNDPRLRLFSVNGQEIAFNDDWEDPSTASIKTPDAAQAGAAAGAFPLMSGTKDSAIVPVLAPGLYTAHVESGDGRTGVTLVEAYELPESFAGEKTARLLNLSTRGRVGGSENNLIAGVVVGGTGRTRLLVRGVGPGLERFGVSGVLARPNLTVFSDTQAPLSNTGWTADGFKADLIAAARAVGAFALEEGSVDCAAVIAVDPGKYTVQISGVGGTTGEALVEIYVLP